METKKYKFNEIDFKEDGSFKAIFSTLNVIDKDGDLTLPGAFGKQHVVIAAYNHGSWKEGINALPTGKGIIYENGENAIVEGKFFLDTTNGEQTYKTVKNIADLQEWSYSLPEIKFEYEDREGQRVRILKSIKVNEVSPVLMGAGINTRTVDIKSIFHNSMKLEDHFSIVQEAIASLSDRLKKLKEMRENKNRQLSDKAKNNIREMKNSLNDIISELDILTGEMIDQSETIKNDSKLLYDEFLRFEEIKSRRHYV